MWKFKLPVVAALGLALGLPASAAADHFDVHCIHEEPSWASHPDAVVPEQHHEHCLIVFERIHGVSEHLPLFVVRTPGVFGTIQDRAIQLKERMDAAMDLLTEGGGLTSVTEGPNYVVYAEGSDGHSRLRVITITPGDASGYAARSGPNVQLDARDLNHYIIDYWMDMYLVFYQFEEPKYLIDSEPGKQLIGMMRWARLMAGQDGVTLSTTEQLHEYVDIMPGGQEFKRALESLAYRVPEFHPIG